MTARLSAVAFALTLVLCDTSLIGLAAPGGKVFVTNSNDTGPGSFRDAIVQANGNAAITAVEFKGSVSVIALASTVVFSGLQDLTILGNGATLDGTNSGGRAFEATGGGDLSVSSLVVQSSPAEGIAVLIPAGATGTVLVELIDVDIIENFGHGVHIDDQTNNSGASLDVRVRMSRFIGNGFGDVDRDGLRVDEGGIGDATLSLFKSLSQDNGADGVEVDEKGDGDVYLDMFGSDLIGNGSFTTADLDDGIDIDESDAGGIFGLVSHSSAIGNFEQGFDFNENHAGDLRVDMDHVVANGNGAEGIEYEEDDDFAGGGDIVTGMFHITANGNGGALEEDPGDAGLKLREKGEGNLDATVSHVEASENVADGIFIREDDNGSLVAHIEHATTLANTGDLGDETAGHGINFDENSTGDLTATVDHATSMLNAGAGVRTDEGGAGVGSVLLSHVVLEENTGGETAGNVTPTFE